MKKLLFALLMVLGASAHAVNTYTPTYTPTATLTFTPTSTPTPTRTNTPVNGFNQGTGHIRIQPQDMLQSDGVSTLGGTALPGSTSAWMALVATGAGTSHTAAVLSTGSAAVRLQFVVPADYQQNAALWVYALHSAVTNTATLRADLARASIGSLTSTAQTYNGTATNVQTQFTGRLNSARLSRVWVPLNTSAITYGALKPGDVVNVLLTRGGTSGDMNVFAAEFEYTCNYPLRP